MAMISTATQLTHHIHSTWLQIPIMFNIFEHLVHCTGGNYYEPTIDKVEYHFLYMGCPKPFFQTDNFYSFILL